MLSTGFVLKLFRKNWIKYSLFRPNAASDGRSGDTHNVHAACRFN